MQARLQARHGERLDEGDWRALEAARSLDQFIDRSRATSLRRFTERLNASMPSHAIERVLRNGWRDYVAEVAGWSVGGLAAGDRVDRTVSRSAGDRCVAQRRGAVLGEAGSRPCRVPGSERAAWRKSPLEVLLPAPKREQTLAGVGTRIGARFGRKTPPSARVLAAG